MAAAASSRKPFVKSVSSVVQISLAIENYVLRRWIQHRAAADGFAKCFAEMTQAGITDFGCRFGYVVATGAQQFRCAFHSQFSQILRNGQDHLPRKTPAEI